MELTLQSQAEHYFKTGGSCRNPYFIGINSAIVYCFSVNCVNSCRNPYFIGINSAMLLADFEAKKKATVAILILLELTLQLNEIESKKLLHSGRNPYFIGINSAIVNVTDSKNIKIPSQSLFYWN